MTVGCEPILTVMDSSGLRSASGRTAEGVLLFGAGLGVASLNATDSAVTSAPDWVAMTAMVVAIVGGHLAARGAVLPEGISVRVSLSDAALLGGTMLVGGTDALVAAGVAVVLRAALDRRRPGDGLLGACRGMAVALMTVVLMGDAGDVVLRPSGAMLGAAFVAVMLHGLMASLGRVSAIAPPPDVGRRRMASPDVVATAAATVVANVALGWTAAVVLQEDLRLLPLVVLGGALLLTAADHDLRGRVDSEHARVIQATLPLLAGATEEGQARRIHAAATSRLRAVHVGRRAAAAGVPAIDQLDGALRLTLDRLAATRQVRHERSRLLAATDTARDGVYGVDVGGRLTFANDALRAMAQPRARLADNPGDAPPPLPISDVLGAGPWTLPGRHEVARDGGRTMWHVTVRTVRDGGVVGTIADVTETHVAGQLADDIVAVVSHELRTPLTPVCANLSLLRRRGETLMPEQRGRLIAQADTAAGKLRRLVEELILVAELRRSEHAPPIDPGDVDIAAVVAEHVERARALHPGRTITLVGAPALLARADGRRIGQVLDHLLDNACRYSPDGSEVLVSVSRQGLEAQIEVTDAGPGLTRTETLRALQPFQRLEDPLTMRTSGAGLGLSIVSAIVAQLGGRLVVESRAQEGTTMVVRLPLSPAQPGVGDPRSDRPVRATSWSSAARTT